MKLLYPLVFLLLISASCAPIRVVRVEPEKEESIDRYLYGNAVQHQDQEGIAVDLSYYDASPQLLVFNIEILNDTDEAFNFDPASIVLRTDAGVPIRAIDPEVQLLGMDIEAGRRERNARTMAWVGGGLLVASAIVSVTSGGGNGGESLAETGETIANVTYSLADILTWTVIAAQNNPSQLVPLEGEIPDPENRFFWLDYALRLTTVRPGERIVGKVAFPRDDSAEFLSVELEVDGKEFSFPFVQRVFRP